LGTLNHATCFSSLIFPIGSRSAIPFYFIIFYFIGYRVHPGFSILIMWEDSTQPSDWSQLANLGASPRPTTPLVLPNLTYGDLRPPGSVPGNPSHHHAITIEADWETLPFDAPFVTRYGISSRIPLRFSWCGMLPTWLLMEWLFRNFSLLFVFSENSVAIRGVLYGLVCRKYRVHPKA
jgi:hypothetical protein